MINPYLYFLASSLALSHLLSKTILGKFNSLPTPHLPQYSLKVVGEMAPSKWTGLSVKL